MATVFSRIIAGEVPCAKVYEDDHVFAFMDAGQVNPGHVIVATRQPFETILELDDATAGAVFRAAARIARALDAGFKPEGLTPPQANQPGGWQTLPHFPIPAPPPPQGH